MNQTNVSGFREKMVRSFYMVQKWKSSENKIFFTTHLKLYSFIFTKIEKFTQKKNTQPIFHSTLHSLRTIVKTTTQDYGRIQSKRDNLFHPRNREGSRRALREIQEVRMLLTPTIVCRSGAKVTALLPLVNLQEPIAMLKTILR